MPGAVGQMRGAAAGVLVVVTVGRKVLHQAGGAVEIACVLNGVTRRHVIFLHQIPAVPRAVLGVAANGAAYLTIQAVVLKTHTYTVHSCTGQPVLRVIIVAGIIPVIGPQITSCDVTKIVLGTTNLHAGVLI